MVNQNIVQCGISFAVELSFSKRSSLSWDEIKEYHEFFERNDGILRDRTVFENRGINTLIPGQNGCHFADDIFKCIFLNGNIRISLKISLKVVCKIRINNIPELFQIMAWRRPGDKPLSEPIMVSLLTHMCITQTQCVNPSTDGNV